MPAKILFVGIGSPHGDDQVGWYVADALAERLQASSAALVIRRASSPADVLDWIEGIDRLVICDACRGGGPAGLAYRWTWPDQAIEQTHCSGTHDMGLASVLKLADQLQQLPSTVVVWGIEAENLNPQDDLSSDGISASVADHLTGIVDSIWRDVKPDILTPNGYS